MRHHCVLADITNTAMKLLYTSTSAYVSYKRAKMVNDARVGVASDSEARNVDSSCTNGCLDILV